MDYCCLSMWITFSPLSLHINEFQLLEKLTVGYALEKTCGLASSAERSVLQSI